MAVINDDDSIIQIYFWESLSGDEVPHALKL